MTDLLMLLVALQADTAKPWTAGSRVHVVGTAYAHATACYSCVGDGPIMQNGAKGRILAGPSPNAGWTFWQVAYDSAGIVGWTRQVLLWLDSLAVPPPPPPSPPPAPPPSGILFVDMSNPRVGLHPGESFQLSAVPYDSSQHITGTALQWSVLDTALAHVTPLGRGVTQVAWVWADRPGSTFVQAKAGAAFGQTRLLVLPLPPLPPPPPPVPPVFGISDERWLGLTQCPIVVGTSCTRVFPIISHVDGRVLVRDSVTAVALPP